MHCQAVESLLRVSGDILRRGGMVPHKAMEKVGIQRKHSSGEVILLVFRKTSFLVLFFHHFLGLCLEAMEPPVYGDFPWPGTICLLGDEICFL